MIRAFAPEPGAADSQESVGGALLLYHRGPRFVGDASNVTENIAAFGRHSRFPIWELNTALGFPPRLARLRFDAIVLHYSLFASGPLPYFLDEGFLRLLSDRDAHKIAFFQDDFHWCGKRFGFINEYGIDCVFTILEPEHHGAVYGRYCPGVKEVVSYLPGYVGPELLEDAARFAKPEGERAIDVGYRGRRIPTYIGRGAMEKTEIGLRFRELAARSGLRLDIEVDEDERIYGNDWPRFLGDCVGQLGVEGGVSFIDLEDEVRAAYERIGAERGREPTIEELEAEGTLARWEGNIPYRTITPRHFETAALGVCQILYEGRYSGLMEPMRHYIPLRKDFSNLDEAIARLRDRELRAELTANARADLIDSGANSYERFVVETFDHVLERAGIEPAGGEPGVALVRRATRRRPLMPATVHFVNGAWHWLSRRHPRIWRALHLASRPFVVPVKALGARSRSREGRSP